SDLPDPQHRPTTPAGPSGAAAIACSARNSVRGRGTNTPGSTSMRSPQKRAQPSTCSSGSPATRRLTSRDRAAGVGADPASSRASSSAKTQPAARSRATMGARDMSAFRGDTWALRPASTGAGRGVEARAPVRHERESVAPPLVSGGNARLAEPRPGPQTSPGLTPPGNPTLNDRQVA